LIPQLHFHADDGDDIDVIVVVVVLVVVGDRGANISTVTPSLFTPPSQKINTQHYQHSKGRKLFFLTFKKTFWLFSFDVFNFNQAY